MDEIHIRAWGRVQGVFFRRAAQRAAKKLGLKGYVCNCSDGGIKICYLGNQENADTLLLAIQKSNPLVRIDRKEISSFNSNSSECFSDFRIRDAI